MDGRKTCKGCGTVVVKPILCEHCGTSHAWNPACLPRTGHAHSKGLFADCRINKSLLRNNGFDLGDLLSEIREMIRLEFDEFRKELLETYRAEFDVIKNEMRELSGRLDRLENGTGSSFRCMEDVIEELEDREKRSANLILYNVACCK